MGNPLNLICIMGANSELLEIIGFQSQISPVKVQIEYLIKPKDLFKSFVACSGLGFLHLMALAGFLWVSSYC